MSVVSINVGPKRVRLTAYCPDDALGIAACEYLLQRVAEVFKDGVDETALRAALIEKDAEWAEVFRMLDAGFRFERNDSLPVSPSNVGAELHIVETIRRELERQRRMR
jgi:hypothetical protein